MTLADPGAAWPFFFIMIMLLVVYCCGAKLGLVMKYLTVVRLDKGSTKEVNLNFIVGLLCAS